MQFGDNYFELFSLQPSFDVNREALARRYRELQQEHHPDRFVTASDQERRLADQRAAVINEAFQVLRSPLSRAQYLLQLRGISIDAEGAAMDHAFLMEQMELREALAGVSESVDPGSELQRLRERVEVLDLGLEEELRHIFTAVDDLAGGVDLVRRMQFTQRLLYEIDELEERVVHAT